MPHDATRDGMAWRTQAFLLKPIPDPSVPLTRKPQNPESLRQRGIQRLLCSQGEGKGRRRAARHEKNARCRRLQRQHRAERLSEISLQADLLHEPLQQRGLHAPRHVGLRRPLLRQASSRRNASPNFHPDNRWGNVWPLGGTWIPSHETWFQSKWINMPKITRGGRSGESLQRNSQCKFTVSRNWGGYAVGGAESRCGGFHGVNSRCR